METPHTTTPGLPSRNEGPLAPVGEPASDIAFMDDGGERSETAKGGATPAGAAAAEAAEGSRPDSAACSTESEPEYTAIRRGYNSKRGSSAAAPASAAKLQQLPLLSEQQLAASPFIDCEHPVTVYEGLKLLVMAPVVVLKVRPEAGAGASVRSKQHSSWRRADARVAVVGGACLLLLALALLPSLLTTVPALSSPPLLGSCWCWRWSFPTPGPSFGCCCSATRRRRRCSRSGKRKICPCPAPIPSCAARKRAGSWAARMLGKCDILSRRSPL